MSTNRGIAELAILICAAVFASRKDSSSPTDCADEVATVEITGAPSTMMVGSTAQLSAVAKDHRGRVLSGRQAAWASSAPAVASVNESGLVTAVSAGTATISVLIDGRGASVTITVNNPMPALHALEPAQVTAGGSGFELTVRGMGFVEGSVVRWNGSNRQTTYVSETELRAAIPAADISQPGQAEVTVSNRAPGGGVSNALVLTIAPVPKPEPAILALDPSSVFAASGAQTLTVRGVGFVESSVVRWNGADRPTTYVSETELRADISAADEAQVGEAQVEVFNPAPGGGLSNALPFTIVARPSTVVPRIALGRHHTCGVSEARRAYYWDAGSNGRLGHGDLAHAAVPVPVFGGMTFIQVTAGPDDTCGITADGRAFCWGNNLFGQLGTGNQVWSAVPVLILPALQRSGP